MIDGIRFRDPSAIAGDATPFLSDITLTRDGEVEVLRGSGSSLYGTNAIGGKIDFQTPEAKSGTHGQIGGAFGGFGLRRFRGTSAHGMANGKFGITAGASHTTYTKGIDGDDRANNTNLQTRLDFAPTEKTSISGRIFFSDADVRVNIDPYTLGTLAASNTTIDNAQQGVNFTFDANNPDRRQDSRFFNGQIVVNQIVNDKFVISGYYQGLTTKRINTNGPLGAGFQSVSTTLFEGTVHTGNVHFSWTPVREKTLTAGYEFENEKYFNDGKTPSGTANFVTSAVSVKRILYSVPSRLIGHRPKFRLYPERIEAWLGDVCVFETVRGVVPSGKQRGKVLDYRHLIPTLRRKPGAFARWVLRDDMFPRAEYRLTWERLSEKLPERQACKVMVGLLDLAANGACEAQLARVLGDLLQAGTLPELSGLEEQFAPKMTAVPVSQCSIARAGRLRCIGGGGSMSAINSATLPMLLTELRLPTIKRLWSALAEQSNREGWKAERVLTALCEHELNERETRRINGHRMETNLPPAKRLGDFDFTAVPNVSKAHVTALSRGG